MHEHVINGRDGGADSIFDIMGDLVALLHGHERIDLHVHIDKILETHLAHDALFHGVDARNGAGGGSNV